MTNPKMTLLFPRGALFLPRSKRAPAHWLSVQEVRLWTGVCHPSLVASLRNKANFLFHQPCLFIAFWAGIHFQDQALAPRWGRALAIAGSRAGFPPAELPPWCPAGQAVRSWATALWPWDGVWGMFPVVAETICFRDPLCVSPAPHRLPGTLFLVGLERCFWASWRALRLSPLVCTQLTSLLSMKCYLGIFARWFWCVSAFQACLCWQVFVWDSIALEDLWQFCLSGVCVYSIWVIGILIAFCRVANSGAIH